MLIHTLPDPLPQPGCWLSPLMGRARLQTDMNISLTNWHFSHNSHRPVTVSTSSKFRLVTNVRFRKDPVIMTSYNLMFIWQCNNVHVFQETRIILFMFFAIDLSYCPLTVSHPINHGTAFTKANTAISLSILGVKVTFDILLLKTWYNYVVRTLKTTLSNYIWPQITVTHISDNNSLLCKQERWL